MTTARLSLRTQLNLTLGLAMALIVSAGCLLTIHAARQSVRAEAQFAVSLALQLVKAGLPGEPASREAWSGWLNQLGQLAPLQRLRLTVTEGQTPRLELPAAAEAAAGPVPDWFRWAVAPELIRVERHLPSAAQPALTLHIEAQANDEIREAWAETRSVLLLLLALAGAVYGLVHLIVGRAFGSVAAILEGLATIEKGGFDTRLPGFSLPEFDRISSAFNHMAVALGIAREENKALIRHSLAIQEEERRRLARELHDEFGQCLTAIKVMSATLRPVHATPDSTADQIMMLCDRLFGGVRSMLQRLRPMVLEDLGLAAALEDLAGQWQTRHPELRIHLDCAPGLADLNGDLALHLFRSIQECLTNIVKHSCAKNAWIELTQGAGPSIGVRVRDDGQGFSATQAGRGFGLSGIRERVAGLGGCLSLDTQPGQGLTVQWTIPLAGIPS